MAKPRDSRDDGVVPQFGHEQGQPLGVALGGHGRRSEIGDVARGNQSAIDDF